VRPEWSGRWPAGRVLGARDPDHRSLLFTYRAKATAPGRACDRAALRRPPYPHNPTPGRAPILRTSLNLSHGPHGFNTMVLSQQIVKIRGRSTDHCFELARAFLMAVAQERAGFTCHAANTRDGNPKAYGRHLTVVRGAAVVSGGLAEPRLYDAA